MFFFKKLPRVWNHTDKRRTTDWTMVLSEHPRRWDLHPDYPEVFWFSPISLFTFDVPVIDRRESSVNWIAGRRKCCSFFRSYFLSKFFDENLARSRNYRWPFCLSASPQTASIITQLMMESSSLESCVARVPTGMIQPLGIITTYHLLAIYSLHP